MAVLAKWAERVRIFAVSEEPVFDNCWTIGEDTLSFLVEELQSLRMEHLVEFGSGASTVRLALRFPQTAILSIENSPRFYQHTLRLLDNVPAHRVTLELRDLHWQRHGFGLYQSYHPGPMPDRVDAAIIDGPPWWTTRGREACLYQVFDVLRIGGRVYLDDFGRPAEQQIVRNWLSSYPGAFQVKAVACGHGLCVLEKINHLRRPRRMALAVLRDNWLGNSRRLLSRIRSSMFCASLLSRMQTSLAPGRKPLD